MKSSTALWIVGGLAIAWLLMNYVGGQMFTTQPQSFGSWLTTLHPFSGQPQTPPAPNMQWNYNGSQWVQIPMGARR